MIQRLRFYSMNRVDVGIGASKDVTVICVHDSNAASRDGVALAGHPKPEAVGFELLGEDMLRVINNSNNVVSLWPGGNFLTVVPDHPVYKAWIATLNLTMRAKPKTAVFKAEVTDISVDIGALDLSDSIKAKLREAGYAKMSDFEGCTGRDLIKIRGIGAATAIRILKSISSLEER